ncbi:hypothetical protein [Streptomyces cucumeris]|uniref:hypothetical protein n=1 Tax=Streptomyces cucumeris TaxID=2962890 RepID=UPI003D732213
MRSTTTLAALCATATAALALTACGGGDGSKTDDTPSRAATTARKGGLADLTGPQILDKAVKATKAATSLTVDLDGVVDGGALKYRMTSDTKGECKGTMDLGDEGAVELIKTGDTAYMKYDATFWESQGEDGKAAAKLIGDRWTKTDASGPDAKDLVDACDAGKMTAGFVTGPSDARKGRSTTVDGVPAVTLTERGGGETTTMYVAARGKPYILKVVIKGGDQPGTLLLSDFDEPVGAKAPTGDVVDLDELAG